MFEMLLMAQVATADYACWMETNAGQVLDLSYLCGVSARTQALVSNSTEFVSEEFEPTEQKAFTPYTSLPGVLQCTETRTQAIVNDPNRTYVLGTRAVTLSNCAVDSSVIRVRRRALKDGVFVEVVEDLVYNSFWVRTSADPTSGYGPFSRYVAASEWATQEYGI
jgi:hypothetical protein